MTNKTVTFTFENPTPKPMKVTQVTLGLKPVDNATAQKATDVMTGIVNKLLPKLQEKHQDHCKGLMASKEFTVSFEMPEDEKKFTVRVFNGANIDIILPLSEETSKSLKETLDKVVSATTAPTSHPKSPYLPASGQQDPLLGTPVKGLQNPTPRVTVPTSNDIPPAHATIGNLFSSFFSSDTSEKPKPKVNKYAPLISKGRKGPSSSTPVLTAPAKTDPIVGPGVIGIRPLRNQNNICFINSVFQALMNMPEVIPTLIEAHAEKIEKEMKAIVDLETDIATTESTYFSFPWSSVLGKDQVRKLEESKVQLKKLKASKKASITLNQALRTYPDGTKKDIIWLDPLRGFDSTFGSSSQEDANDLLVKIFDPLLEPLRNGVNAADQRDISIIPANIDPDLRASLGNFILKFGEEKLLVPAEEAKNFEHAVRENVSPLPPGGLRKEIVASSFLPFAMPNAHIALQDLVTAQLKMRKPAEQDDTSVYEAAGVIGEYQVSQKRIAIESLNNNPPKYVTLQLQRFNADGTKNNSEIVLPEDNKIALVVDGKKVNYEIQTLVLHRGSTLKGGHYYSYVRKNKVWFEATDLYVAPPLAQLPKDVEKQAYLVFLKRVP